MDELHEKLQLYLTEQRTYWNDGRHTISWRVSEDARIFCYVTALDSSSAPLVVWQDTVHVFVHLEFFTKGVSFSPSRHCAIFPHVRHHSRKLRKTFNNFTFFSQNSQLWCLQHSRTWDTQAELDHMPTLECRKWQAITFQQNKSRWRCLYGNFSLFTLQCNL